jgi:hypothetical protein
MTEPGSIAASSDEVRRRLFPALSLTLVNTVQQATAIATQGGSLAVTLTNNGLAPAYRNYVEVHRLTFPVSAPNGFFVWDLTDAGVGFWRRARVGERISPDRQLAGSIEVPPDPGSPSTGRRYRAGPPADPETFIAGEVVAERLVRVAATSLAPTQSAPLSLAVTPMPPAPVGGTQLTSWCLVFRCFELLTDPAPPVQLPVPALPGHHAQLICLHTGP